MTFNITRIALFVAATCVAAVLGFAQEATQTDAAPPSKTLQETFDSWSQPSFNFDALVRNQRRSRSDFQFKIGDTRYQVLFDAGRKKRNAILDCLELADEGEIKDTAFMLFKDDRIHLPVGDYRVKVFTQSGTHSLITMRTKGKSRRMVAQRTCLGLSSGRTFDENNQKLV